MPKSGVGMKNNYNIYTFFILFILYLDILRQMFYTNIVIIRKDLLVMAKIVDFVFPRGTVWHKVYMYFAFTIAMSWSQIIVNSFLSSMFGLQHKSLTLYTTEICFMTIVLVANNIKDLIEAHVLKRSKLLYDILITFNILNIVFSLLFSAGSSFMELSNNNHIQPEQKQFCFVIITYVAAVLMGLAVQIGGGIDKINREKGRKN